MAILFTFKRKDAGKMGRAPHGPCLPLSRVSYSFKFELFSTLDVP
jgi:hypothetical protein